LPETAFLLPPTANGADLRLRWFTPANEVPLCGHATVATFHAVAEERLHGTAEHARRDFRVETRSGILPVAVVQGSPGATIHFGLPVPSFQPGFQLRDEVLLMLKLNGRELDAVLPIMVDRYVYVPVINRRVLFDLTPDYSAIFAFQRRHNIGGVCVFTTDVVDAGSAVHSRFYSPSDGINGRSRHRISERPPRGISVRTGCGHGPRRHGEHGGESRGDAHRPRGTREEFRCGCRPERSPAWRSAAARSRFSPRRCVCAEERTITSTDVGYGITTLLH